MTKSISMKTLLVMTAAVLGLAACGGSNNNFTLPPVGEVPPPPLPPPPPPPPPPPTGSAPEQAGAGFNTAFNQGPFDEPTDPFTNDIIRLDKTTEPIVIPDQ